MFQILQLQQAGESSVMCRLAETVSTPKGESFEEYIKDVLVSELKMGEFMTKIQI